MRRNAVIVALSLAGVLALTTLSGCSREKLDWKSAEAADTIEGYDHFMELHPDSALVTQARARVAQLNEDRDWKRATATDTADAYRQFLAQHESGKWAEEARIRVENFALDGTATGPAGPPLGVAPAAGSGTAASAAAATAAPTPTPVYSPVVATRATSDPKSSSAVKPAPTVQPAKAGKSLAGTASATSSPKAAAAAATPMPSGQFGIQLGAFHSKEAALKIWKQLQVKYDSDLHGLFAHAVPARQGADQFFRLQAPVGQESRARALCASLTRKSQPCVVVLPQP